MHHREPYTLHEQCHAANSAFLRFSRLIIYSINNLDCSYLGAGVSEQRLANSVDHTITAIWEKVFP